MLDNTYVGQNIRKAAFTAQEGYDGSKDEDEVCSLQIIDILAKRFLKRYFQINETAGDAVYDWYDEVEFPGFHSKDVNPFQ